MLSSLKPLLCWFVRQIHHRAWLLMLLSAGLQILIFPLPNLYILCWVAVTPLLIALLRARQAGALQLRAGIKLLPAKPLQGFVLGYCCGILWYAGTCYWVYSTMRQYGGVNAPAAVGILILFCLYLGLYHGLFGLLVSLLADESPFSRKALVLAPVAWVAVELARTRISGFPWDLLGIAQVDNIPLARIAAAAGVYGLSFEIMIVSTAWAAVFLVHRNRKQPLLIAAIAATVVLQAGQLVPAPALQPGKTAVLVQSNVPILEGADWTRDYYQTTLRELSALSVKPNPTQSSAHPDLIVWPESPAPFYTSDPLFRNALSSIAREANTWVLAGSVGITNASQNPQQPTTIYNSAQLVSPAGEWVSRYDKAHLVPFGEYVPFKRLFAFAGGLTKEVGDFSAGTSRSPLGADGTKLGVFICYESIFPDEVRQFAVEGAQVLVNISNDGWYGDSGAYAQHLKQARMRAVENARWLLRDTNTGVTTSIDPYGRAVATVPRKVRTALTAPYALISETTFYTRHGDWFAYVCAIISVAALFLRFAIPNKVEQ
ncbi:MAG: apolipoprotein N-acyltransferase [Acidobacteriaceae bacterium]|nr:apolipoprotein N-acyltransferase [Acidobacteriaceae bacterium]